jgi:hypothetical protein
MHRRDQEDGWRTRRGSRRIWERRWRQERDRETRMADVGKSRKAKEKACRAALAWRVRKLVGSMKREEMEEVMGRTMED